MTYPEISLDKEVVIVTEQTANTVSVMEIQENPERKTVFAMVKVGSSMRRMMLWAGEAYDQIGQWTDDDVIARVKELLGA